MGENCELKSAAAFDPFSVCNVIDALPIWVDHLFGFSLLLQASNGQCKFQQQSDIYSKHCPEILRRKRCPPIRSYRCFWCCWSLSTGHFASVLFFLRFNFCNPFLYGKHWWNGHSLSLQCNGEFQDFFKRASKSVPASDELTNGWKSLLSSMLPKILPEKTAAAKAGSLRYGTYSGRYGQVGEHHPGIVATIFWHIDPWRAILYRDPPLLSVDLADGDSQENDMTRSTLSLDSFKSNFFKSTNHDSQLLDELETEPVAARRPVDYFNYYYNS
ncbi:Atypical kinase COQ8B [Trichinella spiralis]|uniref:Atypical kinase COQ8B n=1 Tax=Trichinella spiralis TaxID=6334 RepID=A0ABR3KJ52_TRISP